MTDFTPILNRIKKNKNRIKSYIKDLGLEAYRLYDRDIPEYPYIIDVYGSKLVIFEKGKRLNDFEDQKLREKHLKHITQALNQLFPNFQTIIKERVINKGKSQYEKEVNSGNKLIVREKDLKFEINTDDYLDCGLFLDHRPLRLQVQKMSSEKKVLNLFCYTGSLSVAAAFGSAKQVCSVDMSNTYLEWAKRNFELNGINNKDHIFLREDIISWLPQHKELYEIILLDPPSFSNSKKMEDIFDVQRDHLRLLTQLRKNLTEQGTLYFSNNLRSFKLDSDVSNIYEIKDITKKSIPPDFKDQKIHHCFELKLK